MIIEPYSKYKKRNRMSSHELAMFQKCPAHYKRYKSGLIGDSDSSAYLLGRMAHTLILEGQKVFKATYMTDTGAPINPKTKNPYGPTSQKYKDWAKKQTKEIVTQAQMVQCFEIEASVKDHSIASSLFDQGTPEVVFTTELCGVKCKARLDWLRPKGITDLKTTRSLDTFVQDFWNFGYDFQLAYYEMVVAMEGIDIEDRFIVAVEKSQPLRTAVYKVSYEVIVAARRRIVAQLEAYKQCVEESNWPTGTEELMTIRNKPIQLVAHH